MRALPVESGDRSDATQNRERNPHLLIGVCGSSAAAFIPAPLLLLHQSLDGVEIKTIVTEAATDFVTPLALASVTAGECVTDADWRKPDGRIRHMELAAWADVVAVVPATANTVAKAAGGHADSLLLATILATGTGVIFAPMVNRELWSAPAMQRAVLHLREDGHTVLTPDVSGTTLSDLDAPIRVNSLVVDAIEEITSRIAKTVDVPD